ncbi:MAG: hypothetical protein JWO89_1883, partial [Verrucomicrobiaceae bacterium]|nr:hypothetical protein [Verrucomicrobiaceae bacterium]
MRNLPQTDLMTVTNSLSRLLARSPDKGASAVRLCMQSLLAALLVLAGFAAPKAMAQASTMRVGNLVWSDTNNNGLMDANEVGISGLTAQLWQAGPNGIEEDGGGDDIKVGADVVTDINGNYLFTSLSPGSDYYVRIPSPPPLYPRSSTMQVTADNGVDNDNNGQQTVSGAAVRSPKFTLALGGEPGISVDGDNSDGDMTVDFGFANPDPAYARNVLDNPSFEFDGAPNTTGAPAAVLGYNGAGTTFAGAKNALQWSGSVNSISSFSEPIRNMQVFAIGSTAKVSWVESAKARNGRRYMLLEGTNACLDTRVLGGGNWSSKLQAGHTYEWGVWADTASAAASSFLLDMGAADQIITGPHGVKYQYYTASQELWTGSPAAFSASNYTGWTEATGNATKPQWHKYTLQFTIVPTATADQIDSLSFVLSSGTNSGPIAIDDVYLAEVLANTDFGDYPGFPSASNVVSPDLNIGINPTDGEQTNPASGLATADDNTGVPSDEDLVMPTIYAGVPKVLSIPVTRLAGISDARLGVWADWNGDGLVLGPGETMTTNTVVNTGFVNVTLTAPVGSEGTRYIRFRIQSGATDVAFSGASALPGEVEDYAITVLACPPLNVVGPAPYPTGAVGIAYPNQQFTVSGGTGPYAWSLNPPIPGLTISSTGLISGVPTAGGTYNTTVQAMDTIGCSGSAAFNITIHNCPSEQPFIAGHNYTISVDTNVISAMWFRDTGSGASSIPGATSLTYTVTQPGTYTWIGLDVTGCLVQGCCPISYSSLDYGDYLADAADTQRAWAAIDTNLRMGTIPTDADDPVVKAANALANADDGDGNDDEDLAMPTGVVIGAPMTFTVPVLNNTGANAYLSIWVDYNNNNSLEDAGELVVSSQLIASQASSQTKTFTVNVPLNADLLRNHWVRFRLNSTPNPSSFAGGALGEVEDYLLPI